MATVAGVLKPAEQTSLSALAIAALAEEAVVQPGVLSVVTGDGPDAPTVGAELTSSPFVRKLSFTGSTEVGKLLMRQCADQVKKVSLELGGNAPFIVFDDADLDVAVDAAIVCKFRNSGQTCVSANRVLVQAGIYDEFVSRFATVESEEEAVAIANATPYGLAAYYMTTDLARTWRVGEALEYGILGVNTGIISTEVAPFGGMKGSGIGREGSSLGVDDWLEVKYWALGGLAPTI